MKSSVLLSLGFVSVFLLTGCNNLKDNNINNPKVEDKIMSNQTRHKTDSGLEYEIITPGTGSSPKPGQKVTVHYTGWLNNNGEPGTKFDSSVDRGMPFSFVVGAGYVIPGWDEGVLSMKQGEKRRLFIPSRLGYGPHGAGRVIPPNANLIFDIDLIKLD